MTLVFWKLLLCKKKYVFFKRIKVYKHTEVLLSNYQEHLLIGGYSHFFNQLLNPVCLNAYSFDTFPSLLTVPSKDPNFLASKMGTKKWLAGNKFATRFYFRQLTTSALFPSPITISHLLEHRCTKLVSSLFAMFMIGLK